MAQESVPKGKALPALVIAVTAVLNIEGAEEEGGSLFNRFTLLHNTSDTLVTGMMIAGAVADLGAHLVLQQIFYGNMFTDTPLLDG